MTDPRKRASDAISEDSIDPSNQVLDIPNNLTARIMFIKSERTVVANLCAISKRTGGLPDATADPAKTFLLRLQLFMQWLETSVEISPELNDQASINKTLELMFNKPQFHFDESMQVHARSLYEKWEGQDWGKGEVIEESTDDDGDVDTNNDGTAGSSKRRKSSTPTAPAKRDSHAAEEIGHTAAIRFPAANHPIFGKEGIMHGAVLTRGRKRKDYIINSQYPKHDAKVFGHNGLQVGDWWPLQLLAIFHGAHGMRMAGIAGNSEIGAYSVVTSGGTYEDLDQDKGEVLYYSGSGSHDNTDPKEPLPSTKGTLALKASLRMRKPVRVLRAAGIGSSKSKAANLRPTVGIRYDGLYRVVSMQLKINGNGGLYEQFKLEREDGQPALSSISRPTAREIKDYYKSKEGY